MTQNSNIPLDMSGKTPRENQSSISNFASGSKCKLLSGKNRSCSIDVRGIHKKESKENDSQSVIKLSNYLLERMKENRKSNSTRKKKKR